MTINLSEEHKARLVKQMAVLAAKAMLEDFNEQTACTALAVLKKLVGNSEATKFVVNEMIELQKAWPG